MTEATKTREEMVQAVMRWFEAAPQEGQEEFLSTPFEELTIYHSTLGRQIRNEFNLWGIEWQPIIDERGVDISPAHPDSRSMFIIKDLWQRLHEDRKLYIYISDFLIGNTVYEIKSAWTWNKHGKDKILESKNKAKLNQCLLEGYDVKLILDGVEKEWQNLSG